jgi:hypothetical protein
MERERRTRAHAVQRRIVDTRTRAHVYASGTPQHTRSHMHMRGVHRDIHFSDVCVQIYIYSGGQTHTRALTHTHNVAGRIVGTRNRTHAHMDAMQPRARSQLTHHKSIHLSIDIGPSIARHIYQHILPSGVSSHSRCIASISASTHESVTLSQITIHIDHHACTYTSIDKRFRVPGLLMWPCP